MLCLVSPESMVPKDHPLRSFKKLADEALAELEPVFEEMYANSGRHSIPPERLLKALLLQALFSIRSERQLCEQIQYNMLYRWFLDMDMVEETFVPTTFTKNRERLLKHEVSARFFVVVVEQARSAKLMSSDHFSIDGSLIEAWGSHKSFRPKNDDDDDNNTSTAPLLLTSVKQNPQQTVVLPRGLASELVRRYRLRPGRVMERIKTGVRRMIIEGQLPASLERDELVHFVHGTETT